MQAARFASTPLPANLHLSRKDKTTSVPQGDHVKSALYAPMVGSLMYAMVGMRPDIAHAVGVVSRFMHIPNRSHQNAVNHIFKYLVGTQDYNITFALEKPLSLVGCSNSNYGGCIDNQISTFGSCFKFEHGSISRRSKLEDYTATSTTEINGVYSGIKCG